VQVATVVLNMALTPFLIFGWGTGKPLGVAGAAIATFLAILVGTVWLVTYFVPPDAYLRFVKADLWPQPRLWRDLLKIGMPAGAEFALMSVYLFLVYSVSRPFGAAAQAGFGIGLRVIQAFFMPVVALGFSVAPVAGQNFGAHLGERVRQTFTTAVLLACLMMLALAAVAQVAPTAMMRPFSSDPEVLRVGTEYLRIISWTFVASGIVFVSSSMFQALGNTVPPLVSSFTRIVLVAIPLLLLARQPGFTLRWIWYLSVATVGIQMTMNLLLLRREFRKRLAFTEDTV
jgi:putative MATE family efflux protein